VVIYQHPQDKARGKVLKELLSWIASPSGQEIAGSLDYVPLPENVQALAQKTLSQMHV
jgi:ABC-type phosphate transport system substrate-binding protein